MALDWRIPAGTHPQIDSLVSRSRTATRSKQFEGRITSNPAQCGGRPCIRGMGNRMADVLEKLADGVCAEEILTDFPDLEPEDIRPCFFFAARRTEIPLLG